MSRRSHQNMRKKVGAMRSASNYLNRRLFIAIMYVVCIATLVFVMWYFNELWCIKQKASPTVNQKTSSSSPTISNPWLKRMRSRWAFQRAWKKMQREENNE